MKYSLLKLIALSTAVLFVAGCAPGATSPSDAEPAETSLQTLAIAPEEMISLPEDSPYWYQNDALPDAVEITDPTEELSAKRSSGIMTLGQAGLDTLGTAPMELDDLLSPVPELDGLLTPVAAEAELANARPIFDFAMLAGKKFPLSVTAPSGATVQAKINGKTYALKEVSARSGVGSFTANLTLPSAEGTANLGQITYTMSYKGSTSSLKSEGDLYTVGAGSNLHIQVKNVSATAFKDPRTRASGYVTVLKKGALDTVTNYYGNMYKLSSVGWVDASACKPLTSNIAMNNQVSSVDFINTADGEQFLLNGTSHPPYVAKHTKNQFAITFARTSGIDWIPTDESSLFSNASITTKDNSTTIIFDQANPGSMWGYVVEYSGGVTSILCKRRPQVTDAQSPLAGITVAIDPGHGGKDTGALGLGSGGKGPIEKTINLVTAESLKTYLEANGATVIMTRDADYEVDLSDRLEIAQSYRADFLISLHCNSAPNTTGNGVEVYYYDAISKSLAATVSSAVSKATDRTDRGAKYSCYVMTLNSYAPSILVEMGFMTNTSDYSTLKTQAGADATAKAITASIIAVLG